MTNPASLIRELGASIPSIGAMLDEHVEMYGETLPHVFMGDVSRFADEQYDLLGRGAEQARTTLVTLFSAIERAVREGDEDTQELISVSFLENLAAEFVEHPNFRSFLGPASNAELNPILRVYGYLTDDPTQNDVPRT